MPFASGIPILTIRAVQVRRVLCRFWATNLETAPLFRQGATLPVLLIWALPLITAAVQALSSQLSVFETTSSQAKTSERQLPHPSLNLGLCRRLLS